MADICKIHHFFIRYPKFSSSAPGSHFYFVRISAVKTSRTFISYDVFKVFLYGGILAMLLYYLFYLCDAYVVLWPVKKYKEYKNRLQQDFWKRTGIDKQRFFNNLNYKAGAKYFSAPDLIDYDIMDYLDFREWIL